MEQEGERWQLRGKGGQRREMKTFRRNILAVTLSLSLSPPATRAGRNTPRLPRDLDQGTCSECFQLCGPEWELCFEGKRQKRLGGCCYSGIIHYFCQCYNRMIQYKDENLLWIGDFNSCIRFFCCNVRKISTGTSPLPPRGLLKTSARISENKRLL